MRSIFGIGNPGERYKNNRHNVGFMLIDYLAAKYSLPFIPSKYDYYYSKGEINNSDFILVKPSTYVNNTGIAAVQIINHFKIEVKDLLVIVDDVNLDAAELRLRKSGGDGGHNGISSIIYHLISDQFPRLRIGVGSDFEKSEMASYVLTDFNESEKKFLEKSFSISASLIEEFIIGGVKQMFDANSKLKSANKNLENTSKEDKGDL